MNKKTVLITGSTSGIGLAGAEALARKGWRVLLHARSASRLGPIVDALMAKVPQGEFEGVTGDLSSLASVAELANQVKARVTSLDALWNNAGGMQSSFSVTEDGIEHQMAVNFIAPFALSQLLLPLLRAAPQGRIVTTSSLAHTFARRRIKEWLRPGSVRYHPMAVYGQSKLATILFTEELARRIAGDTLTVNAYHPGFVKSGFGWSDDPHRKGRFDFASFVALSPEKGADTGVWLIDDPAPHQSTGLYWVNRRPRKPSPAVTSETALLVWEEAETAVRRALGELPI